VRSKIFAIALSALLLLAAATECKKRQSITVPTQAAPAVQDSYEPDGNTYTARSIPVDGTSQYHNFFTPCDYDYVSFTASAGKQYDMQTLALESAADTYMYLIGTDGATVILTDDDGGAEAKASRIIWVCPAAGVYFVRVQQYNCMRVYGQNTGYRIKVTEGAPFTPTASPTATMTYTASPYVTDTPIGTPTPTITDTFFVTATPTFTVTPIAPVGAGLWHQISDNDPHVPAPYPNSGVSPQMWWYGSSATGNYDTGLGNKGEFFSGPFTVSQGDSLHFWSYEWTENLAGYDTRSVFISADGSGDWTELAQLFGTEQTWYSPSIAIPSQFAGLSVHFRFVFDTIDRYNNDFPGWFVDDITVGP
jgi:hypothetical protein